MKLVASGDLHLDGAKTPICRTDNYYEAQVVALKYVNALLEKYNAKHICAGDVVDVAVGKSVSDAVKTHGLLNAHIKEMYTILGNHDLKNKSLEYIKGSLIQTMITSGNITHVFQEPYLIPNTNVVLHGFNWGEKFTHNELKEDGNVHIALYHGFVDEKENTLIGGLVAKDIVHEFYDDYSFIITADHHKPFTYSYKGCTLINTGSLMRTTVIQENYRPRVWLIDTETLSFEPIYLPVEDNVISREHLDIKKEREERLDTFIVSMDNEYEVTDMFGQNISNYLAENKVDEDNTVMINNNVEKFINMSLEGNIES